MAAFKPSSAQRETTICLSPLCISPLISLSGCSVSVEAKNISTINKSLLCINTDRLHHCLFDPGLLQGDIVDCMPSCLTQRLPASAVSLCCICSLAKVSQAF